MPQEAIRIVTFNVHHGAARDGSIDLARTADLIASLEPDLVALQEVDRGTTRSGGVDQPSRLAELLQMEVRFAAAIDMSPGEYGIALAAREPFDIAVEHLPRVGNEEQRVAIVSGFRGIGIITTHLSRSAAARRAQTLHVAELAHRLGPPAVVVGDLNQPRRHLGALRQAGFTPLKPPTSLVASLKPGWPIDHVLMSTGLTGSARLVDTDASDHPALIASIASSDA